MGVISSVVSYFQKSPSSGQKVDKYAVLGPLLKTIDYGESLKTLYSVITRSPLYRDLLTSHAPAPTASQRIAVKAWQTYVKQLPPTQRNIEIHKPFTSLFDVVSITLANLHQIETHIDQLFGTEFDGDPTHVKAVALVTAGYVESTARYFEWVSELIECLNPEGVAGPYTLQVVTDNAERHGLFAYDNFRKWDGSGSAFLLFIRDLQKKGLDVAVQAGGVWMDELIHDNQFSASDQALITAGLRGPIAFALGAYTAYYERSMKLLESKQDWLLAKIAMEEARLAHLDERSSDYIKMKRALDYYAKEVRRIQQEIERIRT